LDNLQATPISGTENASNPFFSPDGQWVGFFTEDNLKKVSITGGPATTLGSVVNGGRGGSWGTDGNIIFAPRFDAGLFRIPAGGGTAQSITMLDGKKREGSHRFPYYLPNGKAVLFTVGTGSSWDDAQIEVLQLGTGERKLLIQGGSDGRYVPTGHLLYLRAGT